MIASATDKNGNVLSYVYDSSDRLVALQDDLGRSLDFGYDDATGLIISVTDPLGRSMQYSYDIIARLTEATDPEV